MQYRAIIVYIWTDIVIVNIDIHWLIIHD